PQSKLQPSSSSLHARFPRRHSSSLVSHSSLTTYRHSRSLTTLVADFVSDLSSRQQIQLHPVAAVRSLTPPSVNITMIVIPNRPNEAS
ncbi:hypothetical protein Csa_019155, partial [Cucumis sativus]